MHFLYLGGLVIHLGGLKHIVSSWLVLRKEAPEATHKNDPESYKCKD